MTSSVNHKLLNRDRALIQLSRIVLCLTLAFGITAFTLFYLNQHTPVPDSWGTDGGVRNNLKHWFNIVNQALLTPLLGGVLALLILRKQPRQRVGWILLAVSCLQAFDKALSEWAVYGYYTANTIFGHGFAAWLTNWLWILIMAFTLLMLSVFPSGKFLSRRWELIWIILMSLFAIPILVGSWIETSLSSAYQIPNPFFGRTNDQLYDALFSTAIVMMPLNVLFALGMIFVRFRRAKGRERQQMKWLFFGVTLMVLQFSLGFVLGFALLGWAMGDILVNSFFIWAIVGIGIALIRHNLYGVDVIIRRTLIYGVLTVILASVYLTGIILLQRGFRALSGQESQLAIVLSTLAIAGLFNPLRQRIQQVVDKRFYRRKYNAKEVLASFAQKARDEVDLTLLTNELMQVVRETVQPSHVSLWLKEES